VRASEGIEGQHVAWQLVAEEITLMALCIQCFAAASTLQEGPWGFEVGDVIVCASADCSKQCQAEL
jgi:hypothetical protein